MGVLFLNDLWFLFQYLLLFFELRQGLFSDFLSLFLFSDGVFEVIIFQGGGFGSGGGNGGGFLREGTYSGLLDFFLEERVEFFLG